ncbi:MAG: bifunctional 4-hydroxy-2-oxoglutarate aldolase/2-dehydro-3-deoxy-phosphogluconate aldolase [Alphaproteobacteria bacterium]|nr:bifunctional 4-hydroxy-2-oxoglutarate aldolase/2-dehydro-3-deoxy-phosphogluconate aldolase [Alphaproteobacteria bacterium]
MMGATWRTLKLVPVVMIHDYRHAVPLARALLAGGIGAIEITLRTPAAWDAATAIKAEVPEIMLGIGTITSPAQLERTARLGAAFAVSPGSTPALRAAARAQAITYLPGVATVSEILATLEDGFEVQKFFPAETAGGVPALRGFVPLFETVAFCPTGGVTEANLRDYLALPNVACVGGSWLAPRDRVEAGDWAAITALAQRGMALAGA